MTGNSRSGIVVQDRDRDLLRELAVMRIIDREQAKRVAGFGSTTRANARLLALHRNGLLRRFFLGTVGGARKALYALSPKAATLVGVPYRGPRRSQDATVVTDFFVMHQLAVNDVLIAARFPIPPLAQVQFIRWDSFHEPLDESLPLIPDGYFEVKAPMKTVAAFVEADLGHETSSVWKKKVENYLRYALSGTFAKRFAQQQFRVIVVAPSERRIQSLRTTTAALTEKIFFFTTFAAMREQGFWSPIWQRPKDATHIPLIEAL